MRQRHPAPAEGEQAAKEDEHNELDVHEDDEIGENCHARSAAGAATLQSPVGAMCRWIIDPLILKAEMG